MPTKISAGIINAAIEGFESQKRRIDEEIAELRAMLSGGPAETATMPEGTPGKRKKLSAAARRRMALAQKARWAKIRGEAEQTVPAAPEAPPKPKRKLSAAGRAAIIAATKKMWAAKRAKAAMAKSAGAKKATPARKKAAVKKAAAKKAVPAAATEAAAQ